MAAQATVDRRVVGSSPAGGTCWGSPRFLCIVHASVFKGRRGWPSFFLLVVSSCVNASVPMCVHGSLCGALRGFESPVRALGRLRRASPRGARAARFLYVLWSLGVARVLRRCYFVTIVAAPLVVCSVAGARVFLTDWARAGGRMRFHVNNQGRVLPCRAKHACRFGVSFENGGGGTNRS